MLSSVRTLPLSLTRRAWRRPLLFSTLTRGDTEILDKAQFDRQLSVLALRVPVHNASQAVKLLGPYLLDMQQRRRVIPDPDDDGRRLVVLAPEVSGVEALPDAVRELVASQQWTPLQHTLEVGWDQLSAAEILRALLPAHVDAPSAFETVGHLAHLNLRPEHEPHKALIGQVILAKNPRLRTVVNKCEPKITSQFRTFTMELLAGDLDLNVEVFESDVELRFNYGLVYWNSRLQSEHR